jgi:hypothetical protein
MSVLLLAALVVAGIGGRRAPDWSHLADQVVLFTDPHVFHEFTGAEALAFPPDASLAFASQPLGPGLVDYSCTGGLAGVDLPFGAPFPTAHLSAPDSAWLCVLGPFWNGGPANIDPQPLSPTFVADGDDDFELLFDPPVYAVGLRLLTNFAADEIVTVELEDGSLVVFDDPVLDTAPNELAFVGFKSRRGIVAVSVDSAGGATQNEGLAGVKSADVFPVRIDVKPGNAQNPVNCKSRGKTKVAILSEPGFLAPLHVDLSSLRFGATGTEPSLAFCKAGKDENRDRLPDLTCHFHTDVASFCAVPYPGEAILTGVTWDGAPIAGSDSVRIVPGSVRGGGSGHGNGRPPKNVPGRGNGHGNGPGNGNGQGRGPWRH